ncbi:MAG: hypothetical protein ABW022_07220 [Actinoplanes sp.]
MSEPFGFTAKYTLSDHPDDDAGWTVSLPHQCDAWDIAGSYWSPVPRAQAIGEFRRFIAEAEGVLAQLELAADEPEAQISIPPTTDDFTF